MFSWIVDSLWSSTSESVKTGVESVKNETRILTGRVYDAATEPGAEKQQRMLEEYKKNKEEFRARHEERKAAFNARHAREDRNQEHELTRWKDEISHMLEDVNNEITALNASYTPLFWHFKIKAKTAEKDALTNLLKAHTMAELKLFAGQQMKNPEISHDPATGFGSLLEKIVNSNNGINADEMSEAKKKQWLIF